MEIKKYIFGKDIKKMPNISFRIMSFIYKICDLFYNVEEHLEKFGIKKGDTVIDYGCGPGRYIKKASQLVGEHGKVYAVDIQPLAIKCIKEKIKKHKLNNVIVKLTKGYSCNLDDNIADKIYALDMFHMIKEPNGFLKELHRLLKKDGILIIEDGHQSRETTKKKINSSKLWKIIKEEKDYLKCKSFIL